MLTVNADALAVAQPRGLLPCLGRYVEHRALPACLRRIQIAERNAAPADSKSFVLIA